MPQLIEYTKDPILTGISRSYANSAFIADQIFPRVTVENEKGFYYVHDKASFGIEKDLRTGKARANRVDYGMSMEEYGPLLEHSLEQGIEDREIKAMGEDVARERATINVSMKIALNHEKMVADMLGSTSIVTQNDTLSGTDQFNDYANSDPFGVIEDGFDAIDATGINGGRRVVFMSRKVWAQLRNHTALTSRLGNASMRTPLTRAQAAALFEVDEIIIGNAKYNTAKEGQTPSLSDVWGKNLWVGLFANPNATTGKFELDQVNPGYTLQMEDARYVDRWDEREIKTQFVRANDFFEPKLVAAEALYLVKNAIA